MEKSTNKTAFILAMSGKSAAEVVAAGAKKGLHFTDAYVYSVRSKAAKKGARKAAQRGRPKTKKQKDAYEDQLEVKAPGLDAEDAGSEDQIRRLVLDLGRDRVQVITNAMIAAMENATVDEVELEGKESKLASLLAAEFAKEVSEAVNVID